MAERGPAIVTEDEAMKYTPDPSLGRRFRNLTAQSCSLLLAATLASVAHAQSENEGGQPLNAPQASGTQRVEEAPREDVAQAESAQAQDQGVEKGSTDQPSAGGDREIQVREQAPQVTVEERPPQIIVEQRPPEVRVEQPDPEITIEQAEPEVIVREAEPKVEIEQAQSADQSQQQKDVASAQQESGGQQDQAQQAQQLSQYIGQPVLNANGEEIGQVEEVVRDINNQSLMVVVSTGGFLGIGARQVVVPANRLQPSSDGLQASGDMSQQQMEQMAEYDPNRYQQVTAGGTGTG